MVFRCVRCGELFHVPATFEDRDGEMTNITSLESARDYLLRECHNVYPKIDMQRGDGGKVTFIITGLCADCDAAYIPYQFSENELTDR